MLEDVLLTMGMARTLTMEPNIRYQHHFEMLEKETRDNGSSFWRTGFFCKNEDFYYSARLAHQNFASWRRKRSWRKRGAQPGKRYRSAC